MLFWHKVHLQINKPLFKIVNKGFLLLKNMDYSIYASSLLLEISDVNSSLKIDSTDYISDYNHAIIW